jgi:hypothetical protein
VKRVALILALVAPAAAAQQPTDTTPAAARAVLAIGRAAELALTGRREGDAGALVDAAELLLSNRSQAAHAPDPTDENAPAPLEPALLLSEAEDLAGEDASLAARIAHARELLLGIRSGGGPDGGAERGPLRYATSVAAGAVRRHELQFAGPEAAVIQVRGSGASNLDVYLYDVNGDRVAFDEHASDVATVHWYVPYTQTLTLVVRNRGTRANGYYVITN